MAGVFRCSVAPSVCQAVSLKKPTSHLPPVHNTALRISLWSRATSGDKFVIQEGPAVFSGVLSNKCVLEGPQSTHGTLRTPVRITVRSAWTLMTMVYRNEPRCPSDGT